jgi:hypothetical protein
VEGRIGSGPGLIEAVYVGMTILSVALFQLNTTMKAHIEDCSKKSALVVRILGGVAVMVLGELLMKGLSFFQLVAVGHTN